jgi:hypothetical protein
MDTNFSQILQKGTKATKRGQNHGWTESSEIDGQKFARLEQIVADNSRRRNPEKATYPP